MKSGRADTFNPSVFQSANSAYAGAGAGGEGDQEGLFVDRSKRELQIAEVRWELLKPVWAHNLLIIVAPFFSCLLKKLVAVDEATVMQEIIDQRDVEIKKVSAASCL